MELDRFDDDLATFTARAEPFLVRNEAAHSLPLGILGTLKVNPARYPDPYLATVEDGGAMVAIAMQTPPFNVILSLIEPESAASEVLTMIANDLLDTFGTLPGVIGPAALSQRFAEIWRDLTGCTVTPGHNERAYELDAVIPVSGVSGRMRRATMADAALLNRWLREFEIEALGEVQATRDPDLWAEQTLNAPERGVYLWEDARGEPVSLVAHGGPTPHGMRIGPVYTPPEQRGHGYASALTAAVSQLLLDSGRRFVFLFTDLANPTSNKIYQQIGYRPVCDVDVYQFA